MKSHIIILSILFIILVSSGVFIIQELKEPSNATDYLQYSNPEYGISFSYSTKYVLIERDAPGGGLRKHHTITLIHKNDLPIPELGEGPQAITVDIYQNNLDAQTGEHWIRNSNESNFKLSEGRLATTTIDGFESLSYRWSGLYEATSIVTAKPNWIYMFTVTYLEMGSQIIQDFVYIKDAMQISE